MIDAMAFAPGSEGPNTFSDHGISHEVVPHPPRSGIPAKAIPIKVTGNNRGSNTSHNDFCFVLSERVALDRRHAGDSGTSSAVANANRIGTEAIGITHRHASCVIGICQPMIPIPQIPTFAEAPMIPESSGREPLLHASDASDTAAGHIPPTPIEERKRRSNNWSGEEAKKHSPAKIE
jgi:hypothetical protein